MFSNDIISLAKETGRKKRLDELNGFVIEHNNYYISKISRPEKILYSSDHKDNFGFNSVWFIQELLYRSKTLLEGSIFAINNKNILTSLLSVRAHFETTGSMAFFFDKLSSYYSGNIKFEAVDKYLMSLSLYSSTVNMEYKHEVKRINTLDMIRSVDKLMSNFGIPQKKPFMFLYEDLCDFCHPNFWGITTGTTISENSKSVLFNKNNVLSAENFSFFLYILISAKLFLHCYCETYNLIEKEEIMPDFVKEQRNYTALSK